MSGLGEELRTAREARGLSLTDVSEQIHIRSIYLQALEDENWSAISAPVYVRGFLRTYARFLGLDGDAAVERFSYAAGVPVSSTPQVATVEERPREVPVKPAAPVVAAVAPAPKPPKPEPAAARVRAARGNRPSPLVLVFAVAAGALVAYVVWMYYQVQSGGGSAGAVAVASPAARASAVATATPKPAPTKAPERTIALHLTQRSWIAVDVDGKKVLEGIFDKGWSKTFHGENASVSVGNAGGVFVDVNGRAQGAMGGDGEVVEKQFALDGGEKSGRG